MTDPAVTIRPNGKVEDLDRIGWLWQSLQAHHLDVSAVDLPARDPDGSWAGRRSVYERWFASGDAELWLLERAGEHEDGETPRADLSTGAPAPERRTIVGYAMVRLSGQSMTYAVDRLATLETLVVAPELRGSGAGSRLITAIMDDLRARGFDAVDLTHMEGNDAAARLYASHGFKPMARLLIARLD